MRQVRSYLLRHDVIFTVYSLIVLIASIHLLSLGYTHFFRGKIFGVFIPGTNYTHYNNYVIFKNSFYHLIGSKDLYVLYPKEQWDLYKYTPTFALAMGAIAWLPDSLGLIAWNLVNALALFAAMRMLPLDKRTTALALWFIIIELLTSVQETQSNALMAALLVGAWGHMERRNPLWATFLLVAATYIKVYGAVGFVLFLLYPQKPRFILYSIMWTVLFTIAPLIVITPAQLIAQYKSWIHMLSMDQSISYGLSVMGWLHSWFGITKGKDLVMLTGLIAFFLPFLRWRFYQDQYYRFLLLAYILIWVIIFNYKAESSTFIIALAGVAIWYFSKPYHRLWQTIMLWLVFIFTSLSPTDLFPPVVKQEILRPYMIKVVPCILVWCLLLYELLRYKRKHVL